MTKLERLERDKNKLIEMKAHEDELRASGCRYIAGIDEVGRGPLAGPVYAACIVLPDDFDVLGVNDSKKLSAKKRDELSAVILERCLAYGIGIADNDEIDEINILEATKNAMKRAVAACGKMLKERFPEDPEACIDMLLIDAVKLDAGVPCESIIKGDEKSLSIAAASIVAKVARDSYMTEMDEKYPGYDFAGNKGYGTPKHYEGLRTLGYTPIHRRTFLRKFEEENRKVSGRKNKVYAVKAGRNTGIFRTWDECRKQVEGFPGAEYKSFADPADAAAYLGIEAPTEITSGKAASEIFPEGVRAYVDGSYDASTGKFSCGVVMIRTNADGTMKTKELSSAFDDEEAAKQRNVAGEIMGSKLAIEHCMANGIKAVEIYHDYEGIGAWADLRWKANNPLTQGYRDFVAEARKKISIKFLKVKAHAGNKYNEIADSLAKKALEE